MRIGLFTDQYYPSISGVVTSIKMLYEGLEALGHECFIFTSFDESAVENKEELESKKVINFKARPYPFKSVKEYRYTLTHRKFVKVIKEYNLDIMHVHTEYNIAKIAIKASKKLEIPIVHTLHTSWKDYIKYVFPKLDKIIHRQLLWVERNTFTKPISKHSVFDIVPTDKVLNDLPLYGMKGDVKIVPTGIDLSRFNSDRFTKEDVEELKDKLNIKNKFIFSFVGRTSKEKNISTILEAYNSIFKDNDDVRLLIVGGGPDLEPLKNLALELNITDKVIFTDLIPWENVPIYYQASNVFINASNTETQGLTYIEAQSSGLPILVQADDCLKEVVEDGVNGILFDGKDDLASKMKYIYENQNILENIKENALKSVQKYSKEVYSEKMLELYKEAIEKYKTKNK